MTGAQVQRPTLSLEEIGQLELAAPPREQLILRTLYETGCTVSELVSLRRKELYTSKDTIRVGGRTVRISHQLALALKALGRVENKTGEEGRRSFLFKSREQGRITVRRVEQLLATTGRRALGKRVMPHQLRASRIIHDFLNRVPLTEIERKVGLKTIQPHLYAYFRRDEGRWPR